MKTLSFSGTRPKLLTTAVLALSLGLVLSGQEGGGAGRGVAPAAKAAAPLDLTGYWVSVVTRDWRWRMLTPPKGDYSGVPLNEAGRKVAAAWDPAKHEAAGEPCRAYGAAGLMRIPGRLHITWHDDHTLRVDTDAGMQRRLLHFGQPPRSGRPTWQGESVARWLGGGGPTPAGSLEVVTRNLRPGYLLRNGVPYSGATVLTEYWHLFQEPAGTDWLVILTRVDDPTYLRVPYQPTPTFKRERDGSKWDPTPCSAKW